MATDLSDFRVDIGRADKGRRFVRVVHLPTGRERTVVGLGGKSAREVESRLIKELEQDIENPTDTTAS